MSSSTTRVIGAAVGGGIGVAILGILGYFFAYPAFTKWAAKMNKEPLSPMTKDGCGKGDGGDEDEPGFGFGHSQFHQDTFDGEDAEDSPNLSRGEFRLVPMAL
jgi:hypothetical protein